MADKHQVIALADGPKTAQQIAAILKCHDGYVRATAQRNGLSLASGRAKPRSRCVTCSSVQASTWTFCPYCGRPR